MQEYDYDLQSVQAARDLARKGQVAANQIANYSAEQIDRILCAMVEVAEKNAVELAEMAVEETTFGNVHDKIYKNHMASACSTSRSRTRRPSASSTWTRRGRSSRSRSRLAW